MSSPTDKESPRILRETAEIAFTEIKRFIEPRLGEELSLRRVGAPLYLPVDSGLNDPGEAVRFKLPRNGEEVEIVRGLARWLRAQLVRYDIAPGFGVFTVMNALRPDAESNAMSSPHVDAWACQQTLAPEKVSSEFLEGVGKRIYGLISAAEARVIELFPHLDPTLPQRITAIDLEEILKAYPDAAPQRAEYLYHHEHEERAFLIFDTDYSCRIVVWNSLVGRPLNLADISICTDPPICSIGGNIYRDRLAMQLLQQPHLLR